MSEIFQIRLNGGYQDTMDSGYDTVIFKTLLATLTVKHDTSYDQMLQNPNQLLQFVLSLLVKESNDIQIKYSNPITILQNSFNQQQNEQFLTNQNQLAQNFQDNYQFEGQLCNYGMMIQCLQNFEKTNSSQSTSKIVSEFKENTKKQLLILPNQIPNDSLSQSLQEFNTRYLQNFFNTKNSLDSENQVTVCLKLNWKIDLYI
ncbi:hypothetical protein ABPG72_003366 [Tetrahymena utriculariae]